MQRTEATRRARALLDRQPRRVQGRAGRDKASELKRINRKKLRAGLAKGEGGACRHKQCELRSSTELTKNKGIKQLEAGTGQREHQAQQGLCATPGQSPEEGAQKN